MRFYFIPLLLIAAFTIHGWEKDFEAARQKAQTEHKLILLEFSGSDWCGPCIRFRKDVLETPAFTGFADSALVLVNADFPRLKKNQLSKEQQKKNDKLADIYNPAGIFPMTVLMDADGKKLKTWEGYPDLTTEEFISQLKAFMHARN